MRFPTHLITYRLPEVLMVPAIEFLRAGAYDDAYLLLAALPERPSPQQINEILRGLQRAIRPLIAGAAAIGKGGRDQMTAQDWRRAGALANETWEEVAGLLERYRRQVPRGKLGRPATRREVANDIATALQGKTRETFYQAAFADHEGAVKRILSHVENCRTCPPKARTYPSYREMVARVGLPGDGSDACHGNCMCRITRAE